MSIEQCTVPGCDRPQRARGYCPKHYNRLRIHGKIEITRRPTTGPLKCATRRMRAFEEAVEAYQSIRGRKPMELLRSVYNFMMLGGALQWRHRQRKTVLPYVQLGEATAQCSDWNIQEGDPVVVYLSADGKLYVRHKEEFVDGRFYSVQESGE